MVSSTTEQDRERQKKEREARKLEDLAAERSLEEERASERTQRQRQRQRQQQRRRRRRRRTVTPDAGLNKRSRAEETAQPPIDVTEDDGSVGGNTKDHINDMNMPDALSDEEEEECRGQERSPKQKKKHKDKQSKKYKDKAKETEKEQPSILKPGRFSPATKATDRVTFDASKQSVEEKRKSELALHRFQHSWVVLVCSVVCSQEGTEAKMNGFVMATRALYKNMVKNDQSVAWESFMEGGGSIVGLSRDSGVGHGLRYLATPESLR